MPNDNNTFATTRMSTKNPMQSRSRIFVLHYPAHVQNLQLSLSADNYRMGSGVKYASRSSKLSTHALCANGEDGLIAKSTARKAAKTPSPSPSRAIRPAIPPLCVKISRLPKQSITSQNLQTSQPLPQRAANLTKFPKQAPLSATGIKCRSPATLTNRRRSQMAT